MDQIIEPYFRRHHLCLLNHAGQLSVRNCRGGFAAGRLAGNQRQATNLFVTSQILIAVLSFLSFNYIDAWVPVFSGLGVKAVYSIIIILPSTFFIGMTYP